MSLWTLYSNMSKFGVCTTLIFASKNLAHLHLQRQCYFLSVYTRIVYLAFTTVECSNFSLIFIFTAIFKLLSL